MATGELVRGRCKATNLCDYCRRLFIIETIESLWLDACEHESPTIFAVLGTRTATTDPRPFYNGRREVMRALRAHWPVRYASTAEFTTGHGERAGGERRPHWNLMLKGAPLDELDQVRDVMRERWCRYVDAEPEAQWVDAIYNAGGLARYMVDHFFKESQAPPEGWSGQRFNASREYFAPLDRAEARYRGRRSLRLKREVWKLQRAGEANGVELPADELHDLAVRSLELAEGKRWDLADVATLPIEYGPDALPIEYELVVLGLTADRRSA